MKQKNNSFDKPASVIRRAGAEAEIPSDLGIRACTAYFFRLHFGKNAAKRFITNALPVKNDSAGEKIRKIIMDISALLLAAAVCYLIFYYISYRSNIQQNIAWGNMVNENENITPAEEKKLWEDIKEDYPEVNFPEGMSVKFAKLYAINSDVCGWLQIPNTNISYLLLKSPEDNNHFYLRRDLYKKYNRYGNPYVDSRCLISPEGFGKNTIIYGHNTDDRLMFNQLTEYRSLDFYKKAPTVILDSLYERTYWKIFAVMLTNALPESDNGKVFQYLYPDEAFEDCIDGILERSMIKTDVDVTRNDKFLTLYTCETDIMLDGRFVVFARQVRPGEAREADTSKAYFNSSARYPQKYYDKMGLQNPYEPQTEAKSAAD